MPEPQRPLKVFLSYASQDKPTVRELSRRLVGEGWIDTWLDEKNLLPGHDWRVKIEEAVEESDIVIICLSSNSVTKEGYVQKELRYAREIALEKPEDSIFLIPLRLDDCEVPRGLRFYQWVDYFGDKKDSSYKALVTSLKLRYEQKLKAEEAEGLSRKQQGRARVERDGNEKTEREAKEESQKTATKAPLTKRQLAYGFVGFAVLVFGIVLLSVLNAPSRSLGPTPEDSQTLIVFTSTKTETVEPSPTLTTEPTSTPYGTPTPSPLPTEITDAKGVSMVLVPEGKFIIGGHDSSENPVQNVTLGNFYIDKYEVTNALYQNCVFAGKCDFPSETKLGNIQYYSNTYYDSYPIIWVSRMNAEKFCLWRDARLPTNNEWEKSARGVDQRVYPWGDSIDFSKLANIKGGDDGFLYIAPVGSFLSGVSPFGVFDLIGNVSEMVSETETSYGFTRTMTRGGAWNSYHVFTSYDTGIVTSADSSVGFRCAKSVTGDSPALPVQTETPTASETPATGFEIIALPTVVYRGGDATVTVRTQPRSACELGFILPSGDPSAAGGLGPRTADEEGICSWTLTIASNTGTGAGYATIIAGGTSERHMIEIQ